MKTKVPSNQPPTGKRRVELLRSVKSITTLCMLSTLFFSTKIFAQLAPINPPFGGFRIEGGLKANTPTSNEGDWVFGFGGAGDSVLRYNGTPFNASTTGLQRDAYNSGSDYIFTTGSKFNDIISNLHWTQSTAPNKNDIHNAMYHVSKNPSNNEQWIVIAGDRLSTSGTSYIDFEFLQDSLKRNPTGGGFTGNGPAGGRTIGDRLISMEYTNGGTAANVIFYTWKKSGSTYFWDSTGSAAMDGNAFAQTNGDTTAVPFGAFGSTTYQAFAFVEAAINITKLLQQSGDPCAGLTVKTLWIKTKASASSTAALKDFVEPISVSFTFGTASITYNDAYCATGTASVSLSGITGGTFTSSPAGLNLNTSTGQIDLGASTFGNYLITYTYNSGNGCAKSDTENVKINGLPTANSGTPPAAQCQNTANGNTFNLSGSGTNGTPSWAVQINSNNLGVQITNGTTFTPSVKITGGSGSVTLRLTVTSTSCGSATSDVTVTVNPNPTANAGNAPAAQCQDVNGNTFSLNGSGANGTPSWAVQSNSNNLGVQITNGTTFTPSVKITGGSGSVTLRLTVTSTSCGSATSDVTVTVNPNPTANAGNAPAAQCQDVNGNTFNLNGSGANGTPSWAVQSNSNNLSVQITGGTTFTPSVKVTDANNIGGTVTLRLTVTSTSCGSATSDVTVTVNPNPTANAGNAPAAQCQDVNDNIFNLNGSGANGTPSWAVQSNSNNLSVQITGGTTFTPSVKITDANNIGGTVTLRLTVTSTSCGSATSDVTVTVNPNPTANAGNAPAAQCQAVNGNTFNLSGSGTNGTPSWAVQNNLNNLSVQITGGTTFTPSVQVTDANNIGGAVTLRLTVASASCGSATSDVTVTVNAHPAAPDASMEPVTCTDKKFNVRVKNTVTGVTYTVTQTTGYSSSQSGSNGNDLIFTGLTFGDGFSVVAVVDATGCSSGATTCGSAPLASPSSQQTLSTNTQSLKPTVLAAPNPFNDRIRFSIQSPVSGKGTLELYNLLGQKVGTVFQGYVQKGQVQTIMYNVPASQRTNLIYVFRIGNQKVSSMLIGSK